MPGTAFLEDSGGSLGPKTMISENVCLICLAQRPGLFGGLNIFVCLLWFVRFVSLFGLLDYIGLFDLFDLLVGFKWFV